MRQLFYHASISRRLEQFFGHFYISDAAADASDLFHLRMHFPLHTSFSLFFHSSFCSLCPLLFSKSADRNDPCICHAFLCRIRIRPPIESIYSKKTGMTKPVIRKKDMNSRVEIDKLCFYNKFTKAGEL